MDESHFDSLVVSLIVPGSRRRALAGLLTGTLGMLGWRGGDEIAAHDLKATGKKKSGEAKKRCLKKAKKHAAQHAAEPPPLSCPEGQHACRGQCISVLTCCTDSNCVGGRRCQNGTCVCPPDKPHGNCPGSSRCQQCCTRDDCGAQVFGDGQVCQDGQCVCTRAGTQRCPSGTFWSNTCETCCDHADCSGAERCTSLDLGFPVHAHCACTTNATCNGVCVDAACRDQCFTSCSNAPLGSVCCGSGRGALVCQVDNPGTSQYCGVQ